MSGPRHPPPSPGPARAPTRHRPAAHTPAKSGPGESDQHHEGPVDLRLVPPALATWLAAALALDTSVAHAVTAAGACLAIALLLCVTRTRRPRGSGTVHGITAATLLCACAAAGLAGLTVAGSHRGPIPALAARHGNATVEVTLTGDPRPTRPRVRGSAPAPPSVVVEAEATRVTAGAGTGDGSGSWDAGGNRDRGGSGGEAGRRRGTGPRAASRATVIAVRTPVLLIVETGRTTQRWLSLLPSTQLTLHARLAPPLPPLDRAVAVLRVRGAPDVTRQPSAVQRVAGSLRAGLRTATAQLPPDAGALLPGLVVGDTSRMSPDLREAFEATDLLHVFAVSGSNLTIILALLIGPPTLAVRAERRGLAARLGLPLRLTAVLGGLLTVGFVVLCRPDPSVLRAAGCGLVGLLAIGTGRRRALLPALAAAVIALILYDPWLARSYGFALSVLATAGLLTLAPPWSEALVRRGVPGHLAEGLAAAAAAQVCCAPLVVVLAAHVSLVAIPCNLLAEIAVAPATVLGFAALVTAPVSMAVARWIAWLAGWPAGWVAGVARKGAALPGAAMGWPGGWTGGLLLAAVTIALVTVAGRLSWRPWWCAGVLALLLVAVLRPAPLTRLTSGWPPRGWRLVACDVGQGDAVVLNSGGGSAVVVDAGPEPASVDRCLRSLGVTTIPLLVLTHYHADHVDGLPGVLRGRRVGAIEVTTLDAPTGEAAFVRRRAREARIPVVRAVAGERRRLGDLDWRVLWPPATPDGSPDALPDDDPNDSSVVLLVRAAGLTIMLLGDLEPEAQQEMLARNPDLPPVDVLKVAHHGSAYQDPELLRRLRPRLAVISCGADNPYGHPAPRTVNTLRSEGATVLRTDTDGPIAVTGATPDQLRATMIRGPP